MNKFFSIIVLLVFSIFGFVKGYNAIFNTDKEIEKNLSKRTKLQIKLDNFFSVSKEIATFWMRISGGFAMFAAILLLVMIFLIIFGILTPAK